MKAKQDSCEKERTMEMRNQVMAEVAHDVSGKLSVINGYTYAIRDKIESKEEKERYLTIILQKVQDMSCSS